MESNDMTEETMIHGAAKRGRPALPKDQRASEDINLRTTKARKAAYVKAAAGNLTAWVFKHLDRAAKFKP
jgi:hypothetical protein